MKKSPSYNLDLQPTCHAISTLSSDVQFSWKLVLKLLLQLVELGGPMYSALPM